MTTIVVIGILAGVLLTQFEPNVHDELNAAAELLAADLTYARNLAVSNNSTYCVAFDPKLNRYVTTHSGANAALTNLPPSPFRKPTDPPTQNVVDFDDIPHTGPTVALLAAYRAGDPTRPLTNVEFGPLGQTVIPESTVIWLGCGAGTNRRYLALTIAPITGLVSLGDFQVTPP